MMASNALKLPCNAAGFPKFISAAIRQRNLSFQIRAIDAENMQDANQVELGIMCEPCGGRGWLVCDFCKGQKTNVKAENKRVYRRCPSCRAYYRRSSFNENNLLHIHTGGGEVGYILCSKCKVFKCVTFPDASDGVNLMM